MSEIGLFLPPEWGPSEQWWTTVLEISYYSRTMSDKKDQEKAKVTLEKLVSLAKRRGFVFQSSEIYGGQSGAWDYGPLGVELKNRIQRFWWKEMTQLHDD